MITSESTSKEWIEKASKSKSNRASNDKKKDRKPIEDILDKLNTPSERYYKDKQKLKSQ